MLKMPLIGTSKQHTLPLCLECCMLFISLATQYLELRLMVTSKQDNNHECDHKVQCL